MASKRIPRKQARARVAVYDPHQFRWCGVIKIGEATLSQDQAIEVLKAVRRATPDSQLLIETQRGAMGRWQQALCQFAIKAGYDFSTIWFRYDRAKTIGEIEKKAEQGSRTTPLSGLVTFGFWWFDLATRRESAADGRRDRLFSDIAKNDPF